MSRLVSRSEIQSGFQPFWTRMVFEDVEVPESTDKVCEPMIQEYIQREKDRKEEKE